MSASAQQPSGPRPTKSARCYPTVSRSLIHTSFPFEPRGGSASARDPDCMPNTTRVPAPAEVRHTCGDNRQPHAARADPLPFGSDKHPNQDRPVPEARFGSLAAPPGTPKSFLTESVSRFGPLAQSGSSRPESALDYRAMLHTA